MLESLTQRLTDSLRKLSGQATLTQGNIAEALEEIQRALLSADVHFRVAKEFVAKVKDAAIGQAVTQSVSPAQQFTKIVHDALVDLLGEDSSKELKEKPLRILMVGLHGAGKTTTCAKLGRLLKKQGYKPALIACDVYRPAAMDQLQTLAKKEDLLVYVDTSTKDVGRIAREGQEAMRAEGADLFIFDTAGRLHIDEPLVEEIKALRKGLDPQEVFFVADSALGQEAVQVCQSFHDAVPLTGIVLTKLDSDARGGAALSMKARTQVPIRYMGFGERPEDFSTFHADRMAQRILGMGDVVSLVEKAQEQLDQKEAERLAQRMQEAEFNFEDMLAQMRQMKRLGSLSSITKLMPGMSNLNIGDKEEKQMKRTEAIILSMTLKERREPRLLGAQPNRRSRIARGSGTQIRDVNALLKQHEQMKKMMKLFKGGGGKAKKLLSGFMGG